MFKQIRTGRAVLRVSQQLLKRHPVFLLPLMASWLVYAPLLLYAKYFFPWQELTIAQWFLSAFFVLFAFTFILASSNLIALELIQQLETGKPISVRTALADTVKKDLIRSLPIMVGWAFLWLILILAEVMLSKKKSNKEEFSPENAAKALANYQDITIGEALVRTVNKGLRIIIFLILPAIAWEGKRPIDAAKKGLTILHTHLYRFAKGFLVTELAALILFAPPGLLFLVSDKLSVEFPDIIWYYAMAYCAFAWSLSVFIEQMFAAELYLWHLIWEKEVEISQKRCTRIPKFVEVKRPDVLDEVNDFFRTSIS